MIYDSQKHILNSALTTHIDKLQAIVFHNIDYIDKDNIEILKKAFLNILILSCNVEKISNELFIKLINEYVKSFKNTELKEACENLRKISIADPEYLSSSNVQLNSLDIKFPSKDEISKYIQLIFKSIYTKCSTIEINNSKDLKRIDVIIEDVLESTLETHIKK